MKTQSLAFLLGVLLLQSFVQLPGQYWVGIILLIVLSGFFIKRNLFVNLTIAFLLGIAWSLWYAHHQLNWRLPAELEGKNIQVSGYIASLPSHSSRQDSFLFYATQINDKTINHLIKLSWLKPEQELVAGDEWRLTVKLKRIYGAMNPGGFDYEAWAFKEGIAATGSVIAKQNLKLSSHWYHYPLNRFRQFLQKKIESNLPASNTSCWIEALVLGERNHISQENWEVLRNTGTNHLMAIAGLHIGFMAAFTHKLVCFIWSRASFLALLLPAQEAAAVASLILAFVYSALAGFSIPTQRACIMLTVFLITVLLRRKMIAWQTWSVALFFVLLLNPTSVLTDSFWLSFGSVALIIYGMSGRLSIKNLWWKWGRVQWVIAIGLIPLGIWLFHQFSLIGFIANSVAIPWVGFLLVPLCLIGAFCLLISAKLGAMILLLADKLLGWLWCTLSYFSHLSWASWSLVMPNHFALIASCVGMVLLLLPAGFPGRYLGVIWLLPLIFYSPALPEAGEVWLTLLDVGQGLAVVVQTQHHLLIFDTGPRLSENMDSGENVVNPFLYTLKAKKIDALVVSHGDNDHIGGSQAILKRFPVAVVKTSVPALFSPFPATACLRGDAWEWDKVHFDFLYPSLTELNLGNDSSCVLRVTTGDQHILLTGDIEKAAENYLVSEEKEQLFSQVLVAPHHGSKTSAEDDFLQAVKPSYVLYGVGYRNRYHFPHAVVVEKYRTMGVKQLDTVSAGAIKLSVSPQAVRVVSRYRGEHRHYWGDPE